MQRKSLALLAIAFTLLSVFLLQMSVTQAAAPQQGVTPAVTDEPVLLEQPIRIKIRQSIPFTVSLLPAAEITATDELTETDVGLAATGSLTESLVLTDTDSGADIAVEETPEIAAPDLAAADEVTSTETLTAPVVLSSVPVTLLLELEFVVTQTLTTTAPASVTVQLPDFQTQTVPIEVVIAPIEDGEAIIELVLPEELTAEPELAVTPTLTATEELTETVIPTPTAEATLAPSINGVPLINTTVIDNANLRAGPGTTFAAVAQATTGQTVQIAAVSEDGGWYLLGTGAWIANFLVADQPANVPVVNDQILQAITGETPTAPAEATPEAPAATGVLTPTVTVDANLRAGPGTEFAVLGGTVTGQEISIVGRNADSTWFWLDNGGWVFATLVVNPPAPASVPVVNNDGTPLEAPVEPPAAAPEQTPALGGLLPTPTPQAAQPQSEALAAYLASAFDLIVEFDFARERLDGLLGEVNNNSALLTDAAWTTRINAALTFLRRTSASVGELTVPTGAETIHGQLEAAAISYTQAASALTLAVQAASLIEINEADALISAATASLTGAETAILQARGQ